MRSSRTVPFRVDGPPPPSASAPRLRRVGALALALLLVSAALPTHVRALTWPPATDRGASTAEEYLPDRLLVRFSEDAPRTVRKQARAAVGAEQHSRIDALGVDVWRVPEHALERALTGLRQNPHVVYAERDGIVTIDDAVVPDDPEFSRQWGLERVDAPSAWSLSTGTASVTIAILDTGVAPVADLAAKLLPGRNVMTGTSDTNDEHGHGTLAAGVAAAETDNTYGVAAYCWECSILPVKIMDGGSGSMSNLAKGIVWAADNGADVVSMSVSGGSGSATVLDAVRYAEARDVNLVAAAGNQGDTAKRYPAAYPEVVAVAGTTSSDTLYSWSNYGNWVEVSAPGSNRSTASTGSFLNFAGTSSATPAAAGILGLARSLGADATAARTALLDGAEPLPFVRHGRVDAMATLASLGDAPPEQEPDPEPNEPPSAAFDIDCTDLDCTFDASASTDPDGEIVEHDWDLGDGTFASGETATHAYPSAGHYTVTLTVTDDDGATDSTSESIEVTEPEPEPEPEPGPEPEPEPEPEPDPEIALTATGSKTRGLNAASLEWSGAAGSDVDLLVDGSSTPIPNTGAYHHETGTRGNPAISYQICDADACSAVVTVTSW